MSSAPLPSFAGGEVDETRMKASLKTLELLVRRRLDGVLKGDHQGLLPGPGSEPGESRPYTPGDDVRLMDWSVTARTTHPHVRQMIADRELQTWIVVDLSASMDFGSVSGTKRDLAVAASAAVTHLVAGAANRVGCIVTNGSTTLRVQPRAGRAHRQLVLRTIAGAPRAIEGTRGDLRGALDSLRRPEQPRGLIVVISDFLGDIDYVRELRGLAAKHEVLAVEVLDPRDVELPDVGEIALRDAETGAVRELTVTPELQARFADAAQKHRQDVARTLRGVGAPVLELRTDRDWLADIGRFVAARRRGLAGAS
ncbi:hypothetical protein TPAU25S_01742 [Tsukamurella paurometabola]|uniref:DUF58 domain-containing protein n=2 Tax=Tsukamurella paurometabola TaxID=2061 RepID=D5UPD5_TSUPD|nr:conserved hypothetical protein [Tsukamurella paurometabola DSM 20162]SUP32759.1 Uncharacterized conserved protein (some members contain a von Willebrand factor type A (vWA) domain) [Tsukamurella paurometabola]